MTSGVAVFAQLVVALVVLGVIVAFFNRFYRKATGDTALIRTGAGGKKVVIDGGCLVLPFMHRVEEINMRTMRVEIVRKGESSLITADRLRIDVEMEFLLRVVPNPAGVSTAAQAIGARALRPDEIRSLFGAKFIDAMQACASQVNMDQLHDDRAGFVAAVSASFAAGLTGTGLKVETVSLTKLDQTPLTALDENNAFNAVGMRHIAEIISSNKKERTAVEAEADVAVRQTNLDAAKRRMAIEHEQEQAKISQQLEIEKLRTSAETERERAQQDAHFSTEQNKIETGRKLRDLEIERDLQLRQREIQSLEEIEARKIASQAQLADKRVEEIEADVRVEAARTAIIRAQEDLQTEKEIAVARRESQLANIRAEQEAGKNQVLGESEGKIQVAKAQSSLEATQLESEARQLEARAEAAAMKAKIEAENERSQAARDHQVALERLATMPLMAQQMAKSVEKIDSIRINQITGLDRAGGAPAGKGGGSNATVSSAIDGVLDLALQLPAMKRLGETIGMEMDSGLPQKDGGNPKGGDSGKDTD